MLRITVEKQENATTLALEGRLAGSWVAELEQSWSAAKAAAAGASIRVHLRAVSYVDAPGKELLARMHREGAELVAVGCMTRAIVAEITGERGGATRAGGFGRLGRKPLFIIFFLIAGLIFGPDAGAQARPQEKAPLRLTLRDSIALALKQNPQVQIAILNTAQSEQDRTIALMKLRRRRPNHLALDELIETEGDSIPREIVDWGPTPEQRYSQRELQEILAGAMGQISPANRVVFQLRDVEEFSIDETAQVLGLSISAVKSRLLRARLELRRWLEELGARADRKASPSFK